MILTEAWVPGHSRTKGSLTAKGGYAADTAHSKRWRAFMAEVVRRDIARRPAVLYPYAGPVAVWFAAWIPKDTEPAPDEEPIWGGAGDVDKLGRNVLDALGSPRDPARRDAALCAELYLDDNQVVRLHGVKFTARPGLGRPMGMLIQVVTHESDEAHYLAAATRVRGASSAALR